MKNLETLGVKNLDQNELSNVNGGIIGWLIIGIATGYHVEYYKQKGELKWY